MNTNNENELIELRKLADLAAAFHKDVMPQIGLLAIQDYAALNALGIALASRKKSLVDNLPNDD